MGTWVANRVTDKLTPVTDSIFCCRSGSAADTQAITDIVKYRLNFMEIDQGRPASVRDAAWAFKEIAYEYRDSLMAGLIGKSERRFITQNLMRTECFQLPDMITRAGADRCGLFQLVACVSGSQ